MKFTDWKKQIEQVFFSKKLKYGEGRFMITAKDLSA